MNQETSLTSAPYLAKLNDDQRRAVEHGVTGRGANVAPPLLVIAGAGSGKTNTLAHRVAHLIVHGADPARILLLTFSRRAAAEMDSRAQRIVAAALGTTHGASSISLPWAGTFHAIGARILRQYANSIGLEPNFTIHDREDSADLMNLVRHEIELSDKDKRFPTKSTCLQIYSRAVNATEPLEQVLRQQFPWCAAWESELRALFDAYVAAKQRQKVLDYDDLLLYWAELMKVPELARDVGGQFDHVLVDEYQDTNALQATILLGLKPDGYGLTVVGDDAQAIYGFRAANVRNILDFPTLFNPPATLVTLEQNYRSTQAILAAANAVIGLAAERFTKNLYSDRLSNDVPTLVTVMDDSAQAAFIVTTILENREAGIPLKRQAVLFRTASHSAMLEIALTRRNIPFVKFGGLKFIEAAHVKDLLAVMRWIENPADRVSGFRVLQLLDGIGPTSAGKALDGMSGRDPIDALATFRPPAKSVEGWRGLVLLLRELQGKATPWPAELDRVKSWYQPHLERKHADAVVRAADLEQLAAIAAGYPTRAKFLTDLTLDPPNASSAEAGAPLRDEDYLTLSTIHSAKGQEWAAVFILNVIDGCMPSDLATGNAADIEEERRLLYVAMTRAEHQLHLMVPQRFYNHQQSRRGDAHVYAMRSRFIPASVATTFAHRTWVDGSSITTASRASTVTVDLGGRLRGMWQRTGS
ncbi:ATP-dependent helicase [Leptospira interrogans]